MTWIKCSERTPKDYTRVIINIKDCGLAIAFWAEQAWRVDFVIRSNVDMGRKEITHWMPLPELPEDI